MKYLLTGQETQRLKFRLLEDNDFTPWLALFSEKSVAGFIGMAHIKTIEDQCKAWYDRVYTRYANDTGGMNVLIDKSSGEIIGQCGLHIREIDGVPMMEVGYAILPLYWNKGYATEAAQKCMDYAFEHDFTDSLISVIDIANIHSQKIARHNGMRIAKSIIYNGAPVDVFQISKQEWANRRGK